MRVQLIVFGYFSINKASGYAYIIKVQFMFIIFNVSHFDTNLVSLQKALLSSPPPS